MMRRLVMRGVLVLGLAGGLGFAQTIDPPKLDPLLELLVKKGVITEAEATALQAEAAAKEAPVEPMPAPAVPAAQTAPAPAPAPAPAELPAALKGLKIGTSTYLSYQDGSANNSSGAGQDFSRFVLKRGYIDIRKDVAPYLGFRITPYETKPFDSEELLTKVSVYLQLKRVDTTAPSFARIRPGGYRAL